MATILLVDDSKTLLKHIQRMLTKAGHQVVAASNGRQAVRLVASTPIDLVLTDLYMPPPDGFELVDAVRALPNPPPIVVMSSDTKACDVFRGTPVLGAAATLTKPFTAEQLCEALTRTLTSRAARATAAA